MRAWGATDTFRPVRPPAGGLHASSRIIGVFPAGHFNHLRFSGFSAAAPGGRFSDMKRNTFNFWIDLASFLVFLVLILTGLLIYYVLPPCGNCDGSGCAEPTAPTLWRLGRHDFGRIHFYLALAAVALVVLHVCLHWCWVCTTCCNLFGLRAVSADRRNAYGAMLFLLLIALIIAMLYWAKTQVR